MRNPRQISSFVVTLLLSTLLFFGVSIGARSQELYPVILIDLDTTMTETQHNLVLSTISSAIQRGALSSFARELYGAHVRTAKTPPPSPVAFLGRSFLAIDSALAAEWPALQAKLGPNPANFSLRIYYTFTQRKPAPTTNKNNLELYSIIWKLGQTAVLQGLANVDQAKLPSAMALDAEATVVDLNTQGALGQQIFNEGRAVYETLAEAVGADGWAPQIFNLEISIAPNLVLSASTIAKPGSIAKDLNLKNGAVTVNSMVYQPRFFRADADVIDVTLRRIYNHADEKAPKMLIRFGAVTGNDFRQVRPCLNDDCLNFIDRVPTLKIKATPLEAVSERWRKDVFAIVQESVKRNHDILILLKKIEIDLANPQGPNVIADRSQLPLVVRIIDPLGNRYHKYVTKDDDILGFNIYKKLGVAEKTAAGLTDEMRQGLNEMDKESNAQFNASLEPLLKVLL